MSLTGQRVFIAESQEPIFDYGDPSGLTSTKTELHLHVCVLGVFSDYAKAEAALDARINRMRGYHILGQFEPNAFNGDGACSWTRNLRWFDYSDTKELGDQDCWQLIRAIKIDAH